MTNRTCHNCGRKATKYKDRCDACYDYRYRTGYERPSELYEAEPLPERDPWWLHCGVEQFEQYLVEIGK